MSDKSTERFGTSVYFQTKTLSDLGLGVFGEKHTELNFRFDSLECVCGVGETRQEPGFLRANRLSERDLASQCDGQTIERV